MSKQIWKPVPSPLGTNKMGLYYRTILTRNPALALDSAENTVTEEEEARQDGERRAVERRNDGADHWDNEEAFADMLRSHGMAEDVIWRAVDRAHAVRRAEDKRRRMTRDRMPHSGARGHGHIDDTARHRGDRVFRGGMDAKQSQRLAALGVIGRIHSEITGRERHFRSSDAKPAPGRAKVANTLARFPDLARIAS